MHVPGIDEPIVWYEGSGTGERRWLHADERGSVIAMSDGSGTATAVNTYDEHGIPGRNNAGRFQYTGQKWMAAVGLYDYKARMYSPTLGRFMQTDPIGYADGMNWYGYAGGDAINNIDPDGESFLGIGKALLFLGKKLFGKAVAGKAAGSKAVGTVVGKGTGAVAGKGAAAGKGVIVLPDGSIEVTAKAAKLAGGKIPAIAGTTAATAPQIVKVAQPYTGDSFCGGPMVGRANRFNPFGRINSGKAGGYGTALNDVGRIAAANGIKPLGDVMVNSFTTGASILAAIPHGMGDGWYVSTNPISGYTSFSNSGLTLRYNAESGLIRIDIPSGFNLPSGGALAQPETCHYR